MHSLVIFESEGKDLGFNVKTSKCMLWSPQTMRSLDQNLKRADPEGFEVLGASIRTETHHTIIISKKVETTEPLLDRILKICIGTPKMLFSLRTVKPNPSVTQLFLHFDNA